MFVQDTHIAWVKLFSSMLSVIIPAAVQYELESNTAQQERIQIAQKSHAYSFRMPSNAKKDKDGQYIFKLSARGLSANALVVVEEIEDETNKHSSSTISTWERKHKRQGNTIIDGVDCYS